MAYRPQHTVPAQVVEAVGGVNKQEHLLVGRFDWSLRCRAGGWHPIFSVCLVLRRWWIHSRRWRDGWRRRRQPRSPHGNRLLHLSRLRHLSKYVIVDLPLAKFHGVAIRCPPGDRMNCPLYSSLESRTQISTAASRLRILSANLQCTLRNCPSKDLSDPQRTHSRLLVQGDKPARHQSAVGSEWWRAVAQPLRPSRQFLAQDLAELTVPQQPVAHGNGVDAARPRSTPNLGRHLLHNLWGAVQRDGRAALVVLLKRCPLLIRQIWDPQIWMLLPQHLNHRLEGMLGALVLRVQYTTAVAVGQHLHRWSQPPLDHH